jgi:hypothetical protein
MLIYMIGVSNSEPGKTRRYVILLGQYSLFGYISQIAVLQVLYRSLRQVALARIGLGISFVGAFALTIVTVKAADRARAKSRTVDRFYKAVFS